MPPSTISFIQMVYIKQTYASKGSKAMHVPTNSTKEKKKELLLETTRKKNRKKTKRKGSWQQIHIINFWGKPILQISHHVKKG